MPGAARTRSHRADYANDRGSAARQSLRWWDVDRNEAFIEELEISVQEFWHDVETGKKPAITGHKATLAALKKLHPADNGQVIDLPPEAATWWRQPEEAKIMAKAADAAKKEADAALRAAIGHAHAAEVPDA